MNNEIKGFIEEGMKRYKEASQIMVLFGKSMESELQKILSEVTEWGIFVPDEIKKKRSTKFWSEYPLFNADIFGKINGQDCSIRIAVNWYESENGYPFYGITIISDIGDDVKTKLSSFKSEDNQLYFYNDYICFDPDPDDFDLHRDFNRLIENFVKCISE